MSKNFAIFAFSVFVCLIQFSANAVIVSLGLEKKGDKVFCRIGEVHEFSYKADDQCARTENRDKGVVFNLIETLRVKGKSARVILEAESQEIPLILKAEHGDFQLGLLPAMVVLAEKHNKQYGSISFEYVGNRGPALCKVISVCRLFSLERLGDFSRLLSSELFSLDHEDIRCADLFCEKQQMPPKKRIDYVLEKFPKVKERYFNLYIPDLIIRCFGEGGAHFSIQNLLVEIETAMCRIKASEHFATEPLLQKYYTRIEHAHQKVISFYKRYVKKEDHAKTGSAAMGIVSALRQQLFSQVYDELKEWSDALILDLLDVTFFNEALTALQEFDVVISVSGALHANKLKALSDSLGLDSVVSAKSCKEREDGRLTSFEPFADRDIASCFSAIQRHMLGEPDAVSDSTKKCHYCEAQQEKLLRCGRCKNVWYCSVACQRKDWATHKLNCSPKS